MAPHSGEAETNRRNFLKWSFWGLSLAFFAGATNVVIRYLMPPPPEQKVEKLSIPVNQIPLGSSLVVDLQGSPVIVIHIEEGFAAFSAVCTHLGCIVKWARDEKFFKCPCHAGFFDAKGNVISGPPPEPLHAIPIEVRDETIVFV